MRTFIALPIPPEAQKMLHELQQGLRAINADVRWVQSHSIHLTLKFLGEIDPAVLPEITHRVRSAAASQSEFTLHLGGLGVFPNLQSPRVVWCGIEGQVTTLEAVQRTVEKACEEAGFPAEKRPFHPHLTLGRVQGKRNLPALMEYIKIGSDLRSLLEVKQVNIYQSTLTPKGAVYDVLERIDLKKR